MCLRLKNIFYGNYYIVLGYRPDLDKTLKVAQFNLSLPFHTALFLHATLYIFPYLDLESTSPDIRNLNLLCQKQCLAPYMDSLQTFYSAPQFRY